MAELPDDFLWPEPWKPFPLPDGWLGLVLSAEAELQSEVCPGHMLYRVECRAVAFNSADPYEFLYVSENPATPLAFVHLTFQVETDPRWPFTVGYPGWEAFRAEWEVQTPNLVLQRTSGRRNFLLFGRPLSPSLSYVVRRGRETCGLHPRL